MKRLFSKSLAFLCIAALSCGLFSVGVSAAVTEGTDFEVIQTFETAEEQEQAGPSNANSGVPDEVKIVTGEEALSGESSMSISHKDANWSFDFLMKEAPAPTISEANGIFFRFKTNAAKGAFWYLNDGPETDGDWSHNVGAFHFVSDEGKVTLNAATGSLPEDNFSGYVFIDIKDRMGNIDLTPIRLMFNAWSGVNWMGKSSYIDNVGYYKVENAGDTTQYQALTEAIEAAYPPPPPGLYLSYEDDPTPAESATGRYGLKPKLTAHVSGQLNDKTVLWSIQEGDAVIESADEERPLYSQEGPITVADATQIQYTGANFIDDCWSSWTVDGTRYWMHSDDWGNQTQKFIGTVDHPVQEKVFNKTREELFTNNDEINGQPWITNIYKDGYGGLLAFLHLEHAGENNQKGRVGLAYSTDNGDTFTFLGEIVVPHASRDTNANEGGGNIQGCPYIVKDNYIYVYFNEINTCVARADLTEVINAAREGTVCKWYKGLDATNTGNWTWTEPGIGGDCSPIGIPGGANVAGICHTQAAYSTFDNKYYLVTTSMNWGGVNTYVKLWQSEDGVVWTLYKNIADEPASNYLENGGWQYASIVDCGNGENATVGQSFYLYCGNETSYPDKMTMKRWTITLGADSDQGPGSEQSCYIDFKDSGKVVVRAALKEDPSVYKDFTFTVLSDTTALQEAILEAEAVYGEYTEESLKALEDALAEAKRIVDAEDVSQKQINEALKALQQAMEGLTEKGTTPPTNADQKPTSTTASTVPAGEDDEIPPTGVAQAVWPLTLSALAITALGALLYTQRNNRRKEDMHD